MSRKKIFIASAREDKELVEEIAEVLSEHDFKPCRWWHQFQSGDYTLDRLLQIANEVDGAIIICTGNDKTWFRDVESESPRDNCILEYGLFLANLGRNRTCLLTQEQVKLPSDINGLTCKTFCSEDIKTAAHQIAKFFKAQFDTPYIDRDSVPLILDPQVMRAEIGGLPNIWMSRSLYVGDEGATNWLSVVNEPGYPITRDPFGIKAVRLQAIDKTDPRTVVSFGPGDGEPDIPLLRSLRNRETLLEYIPVDICIGLLQRVVSKMSGEFHVPAGIVGDFEDGQYFIRNQLVKYAKSPILYCMLGGTFGNLDRGELDFLTGLRLSMRPEDMFLLDFGLAGENWSWEDDPRTKHNCYTGAFRRFMASGVSRHCTEKIDSIVDNFDNRILFQKGLSDVPDVQCIAAYDEATNRVIFYNRRYNWASIMKWLKTECHFSVEFECAKYDSHKRLGMGVALLKR